MSSYSRLASISRCPSARTCAHCEMKGQKREEYSPARDQSLYAALARTLGFRLAQRFELFFAVIRSRLKTKKKKKRLRASESPCHPPKKGATKESLFRSASCQARRRSHISIRTSTTSGKNEQERSPALSTLHVPSLPLICFCFFLFHLISPTCLSFQVLYKRDAPPLYFRSLSP